MPFLAAFPKHIFVRKIGVCKRVPSVYLSGELVTGSVAENTSSLVHQRKHMLSITLKFLFDIL